MSAVALSRFCKFLSTPSARRATSALVRFAKAQLDFYPRPPRGGRRKSYSRMESSSMISIHALREEGD